jgi:hypothetical protein
MCTIRQSLCLIFLLIAASLHIAAQQPAGGTPAPQQNGAQPGPQQPKSYQADPMICRRTERIRRAQGS